MRWSGPSLHVLSLDSPSAEQLAYLKSLISSTEARERHATTQAIRFLEWREIQVSARGGRFRSLDNWPEVGEFERIVEEGEQAAQLGLDFSRRVAERREELAGATRGTDAGSRVEQFAFEFDRNLNHARHNSDSHSIRSDSPDRDDLARTYRAAQTDPTTPRCSQRSPPLFPLPSSGPSSSSSYFPLTPPVLLAPTADPFHLPSLLHLVGLNLRLALLPPPVLANDEKVRGSWIGTAAIFSMLFLAGVAVGTGKAGGLWREAWKGAVFAGVR